MKSSKFIYFKPRKYGNMSCYADGIRFDSRRECDYYLQLKMEKKAKLILDFERQVSFDLYGTEINAEPELASQKKVCTHRVDFYVTLLDGTKEVREVKGFATDLWELKRKLFEANYPEIEYKVIK